MQIEQYKVNQLNLNEFLSHYDISMILNNELINKSYFELYNHETLLNNEIETITSEVKQELKNYDNASFNYIDEIYTYYFNQYIEFEELLNMKIDEALEELDGAIYDYCIESLQDYEVYQYFIVSEYDVEHYLNKYLNYPIYYNEELNIYLLGITHYGISWSFFITEAPRPEYMKIKK